MSQEVRVSSQLPYRQAGSVITADVAGEAILLETARGCYFALNSTGNKIWAAFASGRTCDAALSALSSTVGWTQAAAHDFNTFVTRLIELGLLVPDGAEPS